VYLAAAGGNPGGFDSGLQNDKMFSIKVTDDQLREQTVFAFLVIN
jgi:hypothetical protein